MLVKLTLRCGAVQKGVGGQCVNSSNLAKFIDIEKLVGSTQIMRRQATDHRCDPGAPPQPGVRRADAQISRDRAAQYMGGRL